MPPPVKELALQHGLPVLQPKSVNASGALEALRMCSPDALVVAAFGQILKQPLLDIPQRGSLNVHASLLPKYRGAAPVAGALLGGEKETGATIMEVELALDSGPIVAQRALSIGPDDTTGTLTSRLGEIGGELLVEVLPAWAKGEISPKPQDDALATYVKAVRREDAIIDWRLSADEIGRRVHAYNPWPGATTLVEGMALRVLEAWPLDAEANVEAGTVVSLPPGAKVPRAGFAVQCGVGLLAIVSAQRAGKRIVSAAELLRGWRELIGKRLGG